MKRAIFIVGLVVALAAWTAPNAHAGMISGSVWTTNSYNFTTHDLTNGAISGLGQADLTFSVDAINFQDPIPLINGTQTTYAQFLSGSLNSNPNNFTAGTTKAGSSIHFNDLVQTAPNGVASIFQLSGTAYFDSSVTVWKDDGFDLYIDGQLFTDASAPTAPTPITIDGISSGLHSFTINYAAWNFIPEQLTITGMTPTPEPASLVLVLATLLGFGLVGLRKQRA